MRTRSELREIAMKSLYQILVIRKTNLEYSVDEIIKENIEEENEFVNELVKESLDKEKEIVDLSNKYLDGWTIDRLNLVDQAILMLSVYELTYTETPSIVVINEWVELSKKYSDDAVTKMINAVLDSIYHSEDKDGK